MREFINRRFRLMFDIWDYLKVRKKWWLLPTLIMLLIVGTMLLFVEATQVSVFLYMLF